MKQRSLVLFLFLFYFFYFFIYLYLYIYLFYYFHFYFHMLLHRKKKIYCESYFHMLLHRKKKRFIANRNWKGLQTQSVWLIFFFLPQSMYIPEHVMIKFRGQSLNLPKRRQIQTEALTSSWIYIADILSVYIIISRTKCHTNTISVY